MTRRHRVAPHLTWLTDADGQQFMMTLAWQHDLTVGLESSEFTSNPTPHDPVAMVSQSYREKVISVALYSVLKPTEDPST